MNDLKELLTVEERNLIEGHWQGSRDRHPAWTALNAGDEGRDYTRTPADYLVNSAIRGIASSEIGAKWLARNKPRIVQTSNPEDCAAVLAEIRCYGALMEAGFDVDPIPTEKTPTPDFRFQIEGHGGVVEVATKQEDDEQVKRAELLASGGTPDGAERSTFELAGGRAEFSVMESHPFGAPNPHKQGDSTQTNAISRICRIKQNEKQVADGQLAILWIDFRDLGRWPGMLKVHETAPLISGHAGTFTAGPFWYAFYGWKGAPVYEEDMPRRQSIEAMQHFGRFNPGGAKSKYAAAIICLSEATVLFENPNQHVELPDVVRTAFTRVPWFNIGHSIANWCSGHVASSIGLSRSMIEGLEGYVRTRL